MKLFVPLYLLLAAAPAFADTVSFKVVGIDCSACAPPIVKALRAVDGVSNPRVDVKKSTATVDVPAGFDTNKLRQAVTAAGFGVVFPGDKEGSGFEALPADVVRRLDVQTDASGQRADVATLLVPGKVTIIDFYADWCGPCRVLETRLEHLMAGGKKSLAIRRVNIGKWDTEAAKQATRDFHAAALPYIRLYDAKGTFVTAVTGGMWDEVLAAIEKAERR